MDGMLALQHLTYFSLSFSAVAGLPDPRKDHAIVMVSFISHVLFLYYIGSLPQSTLKFTGQVRSRLFVQVQEPNERDGSRAWSRYK